MGTARVFDTLISMNQFGELAAVAGLGQTIRIVGTNPKTTTELRTAHAHGDTPPG